MKLDSPVIPIKRRSALGIAGATSTPVPVPLGKKIGREIFIGLCTFIQKRLDNLCAFIYSASTTTEQDKTACTLLSLLGR
jgi:hypothetical protein